MKDLVNELLVFPLGAHDDLADTLSMQLELWSVTSTEKDRKREEDLEDPFSIESALEELKDRRKGDHSYSPVYDILETVEGASNAS